MLTAEQEQFRDRVISLAHRFAEQYGVDWRLMAASAILESGWGQSVLALQASNFFGIKAVTSTAEADVFVLQTPRGPERFRRYANITEAFRAYGRLLSSSSHYAEARQAAREAALEHFVRNMAPVYCPDDPDYILKIMQIIEMIE